MAQTDIIIHDEKDNVGVVVIEKITPNQECSCWIMENDKTVNVKSLKAVLHDLFNGQSLHLGFLILLIVAPISIIPCVYSKILFDVV